MTEKTAQLSRSYDAIGSIHTAMYQIGLTIKVSQVKECDYLIYAERNLRQAIMNLNRYRAEAHKRPDTGKHVKRD